MDVFDKKKRSWIMSRVKGRNTRPELIVRSMVHLMGLRFRLHDEKLPGKPDLALPRHKKVIFIHGCFWHGHKGCKRSARPATNKVFWSEKLDRNIARDKKNIRLLVKEGWDVLVIWQCQTRDMENLSLRLHKFLRSE